MTTKSCLSDLYGSKKLLFRVIFAALSVLIMVAIFNFSAQNAAASSKTSGSVVTVILKTFYPHFLELTQSGKAELVKIFQVIVRKGAHFFVYFLLGFNVLGFFSTFSLKKTKIFLFSWLFCVLYLVSDEFHQLFSTGRSGNIKDVLLDSLGSLFGILLLLFLLNFLYKKGKVMRKKVLIEQNTLLTEKLVEANKEINRLNGLLAEANDKILLLEQAKQEVKSETITETQEKSIEYSDLENITLENTNKSNIEDYAVEVIAKIVLETSKAEVVLASKNNVSPDKKNLIVGYAETSKAQIFKIISEKESFSVLKSKIDEEFTKTKNYTEQILNSF